MRRVFGLASALLLAGLCQCTLLFNLNALDPAGDDESSGNSDAGEAPAPAPGDDVGADIVDETGDEPFAVALPDASLDADAPDAFTPAEADTVDSTADVRSWVDASRDATADVARDAPIDTAPPFDAASCPSVL